MIFTELRFLGFFFLVFALHWGVSSRRGRHAVLLVASYVFYGAWDIRFLALIAFSTTVDYTLGRLMERTEDERRRRSLIGLSLIVNLGLLGTFKYFNFFAASLADLLRLVGFAASQPTLQLILPVGISFYTFQSISYTVDVYRRKLKAERDPLTFATFVAFFPQLVAGPIVRAIDFLPQMATVRRLADVAWRPLLLLFLAGYAKKAVLSDNLAPYVDAFFGAPAAFDGPSHLLGIVLYAAQIYCDFSGYSDMAIATAGLLGYRLSQNFDQPYAATSPREFWRRWHISLSTWLRDYLYIPLGGSRCSPTRMQLNLLVTMLLGGLWHGAAWTFIVWGALHGFALVANHHWNQLRGPAAPAASPAEALGGWLVTMAIVLIGWVFFRAASVSDAFAVLRGSVAATGTRTLPGVLWAYLGAAFVLHLLWARWPAAVSGAQERIGRITWPRFAVGYGCLVGLMLYFVNTNYRAFIYFQF